MSTSEQVLFGKVTKAGTITIPKKLRMKYHIKVGDVVRYADTDDGIKIMPSGPSYNTAVTRGHVNFYSFKNTSSHHVLQQFSIWIDICHEIVGLPFKFIHHFMNSGVFHKKMIFFQQKIPISS